MLGKFNRQKETDNKKPISDRFTNSIDLPEANYNKNVNNTEENDVIILGAPEEHEETQLSTEVEIDPESQINFGLDTRRVRRVDLIRDNVRSWERLLEVMPFWRNLINPVNITFGLITIASSFIVVAFNFSELSSNPSLFYSQISGYRISVEKSLFWVIPIFVAVIQLVLFRLIRAVFEFDRRLSGVLAITQIFFNIILVIALLQIISLVTV